MAHYLEAYFVEEDMQDPLETANIFGIQERVHLPLYDSLRGVLRPEYRDLSDVEIHALLEQILGEMSPEEVEGFWDTVKSVGKAALGVAKRAAPAVLPVAGGALGTLVGGPVGTAIGSKLGQMGAQLLAQPQRPPTPPVAAPLAAAPGATPQPAPADPAPEPEAPAPEPEAPAPEPAAPIPSGGTSAAAQLLALIRNPELLKSLLGQVLGGAGESTVMAGPRRETPIRFEAMMNAMESLAAQAALEAAEAWGEEEDVEATGCPSYCRRRYMSARDRQRCRRLYPGCLIGRLRPRPPKRIARRLPTRPPEVIPAEPPLAGPGYSPLGYGEEPYREEPHGEEPYGDEESFATRRYLQDESGNFVVDPANPDERAQRVLELLHEASEAYAPEPYDPVTEWLIEAELL